MEINKNNDQGIETIELIGEQLSVKILPKMGNLLYSLNFSGQEFIWFPYDTVKEYTESPRLCGIPLLAPWANRLEEDGFEFQEIHYPLNTDLNYSKDANGLPIHGLLAFSDRWEIVAERISDKFIELKSRLEFWKYADLMTHFPLAHTLELTYRMYSNHVEIELKIHNNGNQDLPVMVGFHPYFQFQQINRKKWKFSIPAEKQIVLNSYNLPSGEMKPNPYQELTLLGEKSLDDVFYQLDNNTFKVLAGDYQLEVDFVQGYSSAVIYAPTSRDVFCIEPMTAPTNGIAWSSRDTSINLPIVSPGKSWVGKYTIRLAELT